MLRILHDTNYDFIRWWKVMAAITIAFIVLGLGSLAIKPLNLSIEFTGGTLVQLEFTQPPDVAAIRTTLDQSGSSATPRASSLIVSMAFDTSASWATTTSSGLTSASRR